MKIMGNYDVNYVVEVSSSTEVYIAVNYHSLQSFIPWETQCFGPVEDLIMTVDSSDLPSFSQPRMLIEIPPDLVKMFSSMSGMGSNGVRLVSFLYVNVTELLPNSLPGVN